MSGDFPITQRITAILRGVDCDVTVRIEALHPLVVTLEWHSRKPYKRLNAKELSVLVYEALHRWGKSGKLNGS